MKVKCAKSALSDALQLAASVSLSRSTVPVTMNVQLVADKKSESLQLSATDLEVAVRLSVPADVSEDGVLVIPAVKTASIVRELQDEEIELTSDKTLCLITTREGRFKIVGQDAGDFPALQNFDPASAISVSASELTKMVNKTEFAVSGESVRYPLTGILFETKDSELRLVSSDGKRLALIKTDLPKSAKTKARVIVPAKAMTLLTKVTSESEETIEINLEESQVKFRTKNGLVISRLIEGTFPDYQAVVPEKRSKSVTLKKEELYTALKQVSLLTNDKARAVKLSLSPGTLKLYSFSKEIGEANCQIQADYKGEDFDIVFNPDYMLDYLRVVQGSLVEIALEDKTSAGLFKSDPNYLYVLMPLTISM